MKSFLEVFNTKVSEEWKIHKSGVRGGKRKREQSVDLSHFLKFLDLGREVSRRAIGASWFEWVEGSALLFWRWPDELFKDVTSGSNIWVLKPLPKSWGRGCKDYLKRRMKESNCCIKWEKY